MIVRCAGRAESVDSRAPRSLDVQYCPTPDEVRSQVDFCIGIVSGKFAESEDLLGLEYSLNALRKLRGDCWELQAEG